MDGTPRWRQRLDHFERAVAVLERVASPVAGREPTETERLALIRAFEVAHELSWNVLKDYLEFEGVAGLVASKSATRQAFKRGLLDDGQVWMDMIEDRNRTSHTYDESEAAEIARRVREDYAPRLQRLRDRFTAIAAGASP